MKPSCQKSLMRAELLKKRKNISKAARRAKSQKIIRKLLKAGEYRKAGRVALYFDVPPEVETRRLIRKILRTKEVFLPRVDAEKKVLTLHRVTSIARDLRKGAYTIMEPRAVCPRRPAAEMDLIIVPGVGFDKKGNRLGRGAGYYDGLLRGAKNVPTAGICFREQIVKKVPVTGRDVPVDQVITD
jgi:5-formyltetrahydrofolate cyclo-ligase